MKRSPRVVLLVVTLVLLSLPAAAEEPAPLLDVPKMTDEEARRYLADHRMGLHGSNLVGRIMNGEAEVLEALLSAGLDVNNAEGLFKPAMRIAMQPCARDDFDLQQALVVIEVLLSHGAKVNEPPGAVLTPLIVASQWCPAPVVRRLVEAGAEVGYKTNLGHSALSMSLLMKNFDAAEALIEAGARLSSTAAQRLLDGATSEGKEADPRFIELLEQAQGS